MTSSSNPNDEDKYPIRKPLPGSKPSPQSVKEMDLWNLDDEPTSAPVITPEPRKQRISPGKKPDFSAKTTIQAAAESAEEVFDDLEISETISEGNDLTNPDRQSEGVKTRKKLDLQPVEKIGLVALGALFLAAVIFFVGFSISRLPSEEKLVGDLPAKGKLITLTTAETFWRTPISDGPNPDRVRLGTKLVPILKIQVEGSPSVLRIFFRDEDGNIIGDGISRTVSGKTTLEISASAGFTEVGMHAAYRAGATKPWKVEVYEGPSNDAPSDQFKKIYETHISTRLN